MSTHTYLDERGHSFSFPPALHATPTSLWTSFKVWVTTSVEVMVTKRPHTNSQKCFKIINRIVIDMFFHCEEILMLQPTVHVHAFFWHLSTSNEPPSPPFRTFVGRVDSEHRCDPNYKYRPPLKSHEKQAGIFSHTSNCVCCFDVYFFFLAYALNTVTLLWQYCVPGFGTLWASALGWWHFLWPY